MRSTFRALLTSRLTGWVTRVAAISSETSPSSWWRSAFSSSSSFPGASHSPKLVVREVGGHAVVDLAGGVLGLAGDDREGDVPGLAVLRLPRGREAGSVQQAAVLGVHKVGLLGAVLLLAPLVLAGHRHDDALRGERAAEHAVGHHRLVAGVDRPQALLLGPRGTQTPVSRLQCARARRRRRSARARRERAWTGRWRRPETSPGPRDQPWWRRRRGAAPPSRSRERTSRTSRPPHR